MGAAMITYTLTIRSDKADGTTDETMFRGLLGSKVNYLLTFLSNYLNSLNNAEGWTRVRVSVETDADYDRWMRHCLNKMAADKAAARVRRMR